MTKNIASIGDRFTAWLIDSLIVSLLQIPVLIFIYICLDISISDFHKGKFTLSIPLIIVCVIMFIVYTGYFTYFHGKYGQTIGKKQSNIKVVLVSGKDISYKIAFLRVFLPLIFSLIPFFDKLFGALDGITLILRKDRKSIHDLMVGTKVIKVK